MTLRDLLRKDSLRQQQEKFRLRGEREREILSGCAHVAGRTRFDREGTLAVNPSLTWHRLNETMRACFYEGSWSRKNCRSYEIFASQGDYPLKGFHYLLLAMEEILQEFPQAHISVAGIRITGYDTLKEKLKISGYGNYLRKLMRKKGLAERVSVLGNLTDVQMKEAYLNSHVFVCPSSWKIRPIPWERPCCSAFPARRPERGAFRTWRRTRKARCFLKKETCMRLPAASGGSSGTTGWRKNCRGRRGSGADRITTETPITEG